MVSEVAIIAIVEKIFAKTYDFILQVQRFNNQRVAKCLRWCLTLSHKGIKFFISDLISLGQRLRKVQLIFV